MVGKKLGRPSSYTEKVGKQICDAVSKGDKLMDICKRSGMPDRTTVNRWQNEHDDFYLAYARAREQRAELFAEEIITIGDDQSIDPQSRRVMCDNRKWLAAKFYPRMFGDRVMNEQTASVTVEIKHYGEEPKVIEGAVNGGGQRKLESKNEK